MRNASTPAERRGVIQLAILAGRGLPPDTNSVIHAAAMARRYGYLVAQDVL